MIIFYCFSKPIIFFVCMIYRFYTYQKYGHLGKGVRIEVAPCVLKEIRDLYPEEDENNYVGFRST